MLSLEIKSTQYNYLLKSYKEYLQTLGYATGTAESWPIHVREFLHYVETNGVQSILNRTEVEAPPASISVVSSKVK